MIDGKLTIAELLEGGLALLLSRPLAVALFVAVDAAIALGPMWAEADLGVNFIAASALSVGCHAVVSGLLVLALDHKLGRVLGDPAELVVRFAFVLATTLFVTLGSAVAALLLIVPGLYVAARWTLVPALVLLDGAGVIESLNRSWELTERSAWAFVGVIVIVLVPPSVVSFISGGLTYEGFPPSLPAIVDLAVGAAFAAFEVAVMVFAFRSLSPEPDGLSEVFA